MHVENGGMGNRPHRPDHHMQRTTDSNDTATVLFHAIIIAATIAVCLVGCGPVGDSGPSEPRGGDLPSYSEGEPNDDVTTPHGLPIVLSPGDLFEVRGVAGGDVINSSGAYGTEDYMSATCATPVTVNVRVFVDEPAWYHLVLVEYNATGYSIVASDFSSGEGVVELTATCSDTFGFGVVETGNGITSGEPWTAEVYCF